MIVTCPNCDTRYEVRTEALVPNGRILRCVRCGHKWTQRPPADLGDGPEGFDSDDDMPDFGLGIDSPESEEEDYSEFNDDEDTEEEEEDEDEDEDEDEKKSKRPKSRRGFFGRIVKWLLLLLLILILVIGLFLSRGRVVALWPPAQGIYGLPLIKRLYDWPPLQRLYDLPMVEIGSLSEEPIQGLSFLTPRPSQELVDNRVTINITGIVENPSPNELGVPPIMQVLLLDERNEEVGLGDFFSPVSTLKPGASFEYKHTLDSAPESLAGIRVRFKQDNVEQSEESSAAINDPVTEVSSRKPKPDKGKRVNSEKLKAVFE